MAHKSGQDKFQLITNKLISLIEQGTKPWEKPWHTTPYQNAVTGHIYQGINPLLLGLDMILNDWEHPLFLTFLQTKKLGWQIRKGTRATWIRWGGTFVKEVEDEDSGETRKEFRRSVRWYGVFNIDRCNDSGSSTTIADVIATWMANSNGRRNLDERIQEAEALIAAQGAVVKFGGNQACYCPNMDKIQMPPYEFFSSAEAFYATHTHELIHWSGHKERLNRNLKGKQNSEQYAFEELIAELGSAFVCSHLEIKSKLENHASYLESWLRILRKDKKAFFKAATKAQEAAQYLLKQAEEEYSEATP